MTSTTRHLAKVSLVALCGSALIPLSAQVAQAQDVPASSNIEQTITNEQNYLVELGKGTSVGDMIKRTDVRKSDVEDKQSGPLFKGALVSLTSTEAEELASEPGVREVTPDTPVYISGDAASWGQDRSDQRSGRDGNYTPPGSGKNVHVYVIDTGIDLDHPEFAGRIGDGYDATGGQDPDDCNGHGTHVAGTVGSSVYGLAQQATLHPVKALGCNGAGSSWFVIDALNWIADEAPADQKSVVNMSLGGNSNANLDAKVAELVSKGIPVVAAAGNDAKDACTQSPARAADAITVGSSTYTDNVSSFSNYGTCLDIFAPGSSIRSTRLGSTGGVSYSGTSMASPHVAAAAAIYWSVYPNANANQVIAGIEDWATSGALASIPAGSPDRLLYVQFEESDLPTTEPTPVTKPESPAQSETGDSTKSQPTPAPIKATPLADHSPGKLGKKVGKKRATISWNSIASAESYVIQIKQKTRGKIKASFTVVSPSVTLTRLTRKAKYKIKVFGAAGAERSKTSKTKVRTK